MALGLKRFTALLAGWSQGSLCQRRLKQFGAFFLAAVFLTLAGCTSAGSVLMQTSQLLGRQALSGASGALPPHPDPRYRYLRVQASGQAPAMLVLAYLDPHPLGAIEVWFSAQGEVLKLQNGRIVATHGLALDWAAVRFLAAPPAWSEVGASPARFDRERDELPHYRYGLREQVTVRAATVPPPASALSGSVHPDMAARYLWFHESATPADTAAAPYTPGSAPLTSWFAWGLHLGQPMVVYSEQCLGPDFCLRMQRWPVQEGAS